MVNHMHYLPFITVMQRTSVKFTYNFHYQFKSVLRLLRLMEFMVKNLIAQDNKCGTKRREQEYIHRGETDATVAVE